jgi:ribosomal subunit interface protein
MHITVTGKQIDVGESLRLHVETTIPAAVEKYFDRAIEGHLVMSRERHLFLADLSVRAGRGLLVQSHGEAGDAYAAVDEAVVRLEKRLRRYKRRLRNHHKHVEEPPEATDYVLAPLAEEEPAATPGDQPLIVAEMRTAIPRLSVSEAVMRLDLADLPALLFRSSTHGNLNFVYRRRDGNVGWVDPGPADAARPTPSKGP